MVKFLVAESSKAIRIIIEKSLQNMGFEVVGAENGDMALELYKAKTPDAIICEWLLPLKDGLSLAKEIREKESAEGRRTPIIFCTSKNEKKDVEEALAAGVNEYIMKPFDSEILRAKLQILGFL